MGDQFIYPAHSTSSGREYLYVDRRDLDRARATAVLLEQMIAEAVRVLEEADPSCPGAAINAALTVLDPGA